MSFADDVNNQEDRGFLPWWCHTSKTPSIIGTVVEYDSMATDFGPMELTVIRLEQPAVVRDGKNEEPRLADAGELVTLGIKGASLSKCWERPKPVGGKPAIGERIGVKWLGNRTSEKYKREYPVFAVRVDGREGQAPNSQAATLAPEGHEYADQEAVSSTMGDDLPF